MAIVQVTDANFQTAVGQQGLVLVDFWAVWCGPCQRIAPMLAELDKEGKWPLTIAKLNVDENPATASKYGVMSIPTLKLFKNGVEVDTVVGLRPIDSLRSWIAKHA